MIFEVAGKRIEIEEYKDHPLFHDICMALVLLECKLVQLEQKIEENKPENLKLEAEAQRLASDIKSGAALHPDKVFERALEILRSKK